MLWLWLCYGYDLQRDRDLVRVRVELEVIAFNVMDPAAAMFVVEAFSVSMLPLVNVKLVVKPMML